MKLRPSDLALGGLAGAAGMLAMDAVWFRRHRSGGGEDGFLDWELASRSDLSSFDDAGAPAQVGRRLSGLVGIDLPDHQAGLTTDVVHWGTGVGWGAMAAAATTLTGRAPLSVGVATGVTAYLTAYAALGAAGIYAPMWTYDGTTLIKDLSAHLVFGIGTGGSLAVLRRLRGS